MTINCLNCNKEVKDKPNRILSGRTKYCSKECMDIMQRINPDNRGEKSCHWKNEDVSYAMKHMWIKKNYGSPMKCELCMEILSNKRKINWANISGEYKRERVDWIRLCIPCHRLFDNHGEKIKNKWQEGAYLERRNNHSTR